ncbi:hypothetical protein Bca4012_019991 [Brassica carinata]
MLLGLICVLLTFISWFQDNPQPPQTTSISDQNKGMMQCIAKLMRCHSYVNSEAPPPPWCCNPMKDIVEIHVTCLCEAFKHLDMFALINLTQEDALNLISSCVTASRCNAGEFYFF